MDKFNEDQKKVAKASALGIFGSAIGITLAYKYFDKLPVNGLSYHMLPPYRLAFGVQCLVPGALTLLFGVERVANSRFASEAIDPRQEIVDEKAKQRFWVDQRYLQNTLEQFALHSVALLALSTHVSPEQLKIVPILSAQFVIGRVLFYLGYQQSPIKRALGFTCTIMPTIAVFGYLLYKTVVGVFGPSGAGGNELFR